MLHLVTTNNVDVFRHLGSATFQRLGVKHSVAPSYDEALELIARERPEVAILDVELAGGSGFALCRAIKDNDELRTTHVILLLPSVITKADLDDIERSGCDDVLALPIQTDEFYHHIAQLAGLPVRRHHRVGVTLDMSLPGTGEHVTGTVFNVSPSGIGCQISVSARLEQGAELVFRLRHDGDTTPETSARVSWVEPAATASDLMIGLTLGEDIPIKTRMLLEQLALFDVSAAPVDSPMAGGVAVALQGDFNELTRFDALAQRLASEQAIDFNAAAVRYISSAGVRAWCHFLDALAGKRYVFRHCSIAFVSQAAMVPLVLGTGEVLSLEAPYVCESCDREETRLLEVGSLVRDHDPVLPPQLSCHNCGGELVFDDLPARYFAFLTPR
jgi:CheY-like chemotaxis protein